MNSCIPVLNEICDVRHGLFSCIVSSVPSHALSSTVHILTMILMSGHKALSSMRIIIRVRIIKAKVIEHTEIRANFERVNV